MQIWNCLNALQSHKLVYMWIRIFISDTRVETPTTWVLGAYIQWVGLGYHQNITAVIANPISTKNVSVQQIADNKLTITKLPNITLSWRIKMLAHEFGAIVIRSSIPGLESMDTTSVEIRLRVQKKDKTICQRHG